MTKYYVGSSQSDRVDLDEKAFDDGWEDGKIAFGNGAALTGDELTAHAEAEGKGILYSAEDESDVTDDVEEFMARYISKYVEGYNEQVTSMTAEKEKNEH